MPIRLQVQNFPVMKNKFGLLILIFFFIFVQTSCNEVEKLKDTLFDVTLQQEFRVTTTEKTYEGSELIDPTTNKDFNDNKDKITNLEVSRITYQILSLDTTEGAATRLMHGDIDFERFDGTDRTRLASMHDVDLKKAFTTNVETPIALEPGAGNKLSQVFYLAPYKARILYTVEADQDRSNFIILFRYKLRLKSKL
jgi:hypothetical protein